MSSRRRRAIAMTIGVFLVFTGLFAYSTVKASFVVAGQRYFWLDDDQMISMRYARNLAEGHGLVWNPGEPVEGYTNPLWTGVMAAVHVLPISEAKTSLVVKLINWLLAIGSLLLVRRLWRFWGCDVDSPLLPLCQLTIVLGYEFYFYTSNGFETTFLTVVLLWIASRVLQEGERGAPRASTYLLMGVLPLIRSDSHHVMAALLPLALWSLARATPTRSLGSTLVTAAKFLPLAVLLPVAHLGFRHVVYGRWFPNTYYLKATGFGLSDNVTEGLAYAGAFLARYAFLIVPCIYGCVQRRLADDAKWAFVGMVVPLVYVLTVGGDLFDGARLLACYVPLLAVLAFVALDRALTEDGIKIAVGFMACVAGSFIPVACFTGVSGADTVFKDNNGGPEESLRVALMLRQAAPNARVAVHAAGVLPYFSHNYAIDVLGKTDAYVAGLPPHKDILRGHNKFDAEYSLDTKRADVIALLWFPARLDACSPEPPRNGAPWAIQLVVSRPFKASFCKNKVVVPFAPALPVFFRTASPEFEAMTAAARR